MCSILGGTTFGKFGHQVYERSKDRGRDFSSLVEKNGLWICNHRATPTNEVEDPRDTQPFGHRFKVVHNGTVANDKELGVEDGDIDSKAFAKVLNVTDVHTIAKSLERVKGSYAIAILKDKEIILACNYKPIFWIEIDGEKYFSSLKHHLGAGARRVKPYSVLNLMTMETAELKREQPNRAIIVCSGGLDSTSVIGYAMAKHDEVKLIHFDYDCKATDREILAIERIAGRLNIEYEIVPIDYSRFKGTSTLFQDKSIDSGEQGVEYALDWVYARNLIMLSIATGYAEANRFGYIYLGSNLEESGSYPDNEEQFIIDFNNLLYGAVNNGYKVEVVSPLGGLMKSEIVKFGVRWDSPIELSWSCYNNGEKHCGKCGPCYMRSEAFRRAKIQDPTEYEN